MGQKRILSGTGLASFTPLNSKDYLTGAKSTRPPRLSKQAYDGGLADHTAGIPIG